MILEKLVPPTKRSVSSASGVAKEAAENWKQYCRASTTRFRAISHIISEAFDGDVEGKRILDWGSSLGGVAILLKEHFPIEITAADVDRHALNWLQNSHSGIQIATLTAGADLPFKGNSFDVIYGISVLTHIPPELQEHYLSELHRIVSPDGIVILTVKSYDSIEVAKKQKKSRELHPENIAQLNQAGIFYNSYPEQVLKRIEFAAKADYGIAYHSSEYIDDTFGNFFEIDHPKPSKIGQQDILKLHPRPLPIADESS